MTHLKRLSILVPLVLAGSIATSVAIDYTSAHSGDWSAATPETWTPNGNPQTGSTDSVSILAGHTIIFAGTSPVGLPGSNDLGVAGGQKITIDGGILSQAPPNFWIRIGHGSAGTLDIKDGRFHFTNSTATASPNFQIGIQGGEGTVLVGDGTGAAGTAVLNLRDLIDGTANAATVSMNLAANEGTAGLKGTMVINSDGLFIGDNGTIRIGQAATVSQAQSSVTVNGGQFQAHSTVELGSNASTGAGDRSNGAIFIQNGGTFTHDIGELNVGWNGDGAMTIAGGSYIKVNNPAARGDIMIGREAAGIGTVTINSGGQFIRDTGGNVGDLRIGLRGTGSMVINNGGLVQNNSSNWDWIGQESGSNGTLTINAGGVFRTLETGSANVNIGVNAGATGLVTVNGGNLELLNTTTNSEIRLAQNGAGTFRQISGTTVVRRVQMAENSGTAIFDLQGGSFTSRSQFFLGGAANNSAGTGTATMTMSGGDLTVQGAFVVGLAPGHTASLTQTGGTIMHTVSDITVGESGTGNMRVAIGGTVSDTSTGNFFVGRNAGSNGTLFVDGTLSRTASNALQVGNVDPAGVGVLGGTGTINTAGGVLIGTAGTLTGGALDNVGTLSLTGNLTFGANGLLFVNFDGSGGNDRISLTGSLDLGSARLDGTWAGGAPDGPASRYWIAVNDGNDPILGAFTNVSLTSPNSILYPDASAFATFGGKEFAVYYGADFDTGATTGGNDLLLSAIPEPSSAALLSGMLGLAFTRRRRR